MQRLLITALALFATAPTLAETSAEDWGKYRDAVMETMKGHISAVSLVAFGRVEDTGYFRSHAEALADAAAELNLIFPEGSGTGTRALPAVWTDAAGFADAVARAETSTKQLAAAAAGGNRGEIAQAFKAVGESCKGCHEKYREESN